MTTTPRRISEDFIITVVIVALILNLLASVLQPYAAYVIPFLLILLVIRVYMVKRQITFKKEKRKIELSLSYWQRYWLDRTRVVSRVNTSSILTTNEMRNKMKTLIQTLGKIGVGDCEIALIIGAVWTNGIATPEELAKIGSLWQEKLYTQRDIEDAYKSLSNATILLPAQTFPKTDKKLCLISSLDRIGDAIESLLKTSQARNFEVRERANLINSAKKLLIDFAINKSEYMLWPFSPNGRLKIVQTEYPDEEIENLTPETYTEKVLGVVKRARSQLLISLEYGTGITKKPLEEVIEKLKEGINVEICIATKPISKTARFKSEAEREWERTNEILISLQKNYGNVTIYEVPEPYHTWHMWLSMQDNNPMEGIGFLRIGCLPFWHKTYYAHSEKAPKTLRDLHGHWKEMTGHYYEKY